MRVFVSGVRRANSTSGITARRRRAEIRDGTRVETATRAREAGAPVAENDREQAGKRWKWRGGRS